MKGMTLTREDIVYAAASNTFGSDPESPEEHDILQHLRTAAAASHLPTPRKENSHDQ